MNELLAKVENYVSSLLRRELSHVYIYHNLSHTQRVVNYTKEIIKPVRYTSSIFQWAKNSWLWMLIASQCGRLRVSS